MVRHAQKCRPRSDAAKAASDLGLHCLSFIELFYRHINRNDNEFVQFRTDIKGNLGDGELVFYAPFNII